MRSISSALFLLCGLAGCQELATQKEVKKELSTHAEQCGVDLNSLQWAQSSGKTHLDENRATFSKKFEAVKKLLLEKNIRWEFLLSPEIKNRCQLKREIILASPGVLGFVDSIHWALKSLVVQEDLKVTVRKIRIIASPLKGLSLYEANRSAVPHVEENGDRALDFYVNLGDPSAGISFSSLLKNFTDHEIVLREPTVIRPQKTTLVR
jgi:hypothetical protein